MQYLQAVDKKLYLLQIVFFVCLVCLSVSYKVDNEEAIRPLYTLGLVVIFLSFLSPRLFQSSFQDNFSSIFLNQGMFLFYLLIIYFLLTSVMNGERQIKDSIYWTYINIAAPFFILTFLKVNSFKMNFIIASKIIVNFSLVACLVAILVLVRIVDFEIGDYALRQNFWTAFRLHGFLGQPTAMGGLIGFALILITYLGKIDENYKTKLKKYFLFFSLLLSGSRSAFVGLLLAYLPFIKLSNNLFNKSLKKTTLLISLFLVLIAIPVLINAINFIGNLDLQAFVVGLSRYTMETDNEASRIFIWKNVASQIYQFDISHLIFGLGPGSLAENYRAAFNTPLQILHDYGLLGFCLFFLTIIYGLYRGLENYIKTDDPLYKLGLMLLIYGFTFNLFISSFLSPFFSFHAVSIILGLMIVNYSAQNLVSPK